MTSGSNLVAEVAALLEDLHWTVKVEQPRDGIQVDILAQDPSGQAFVVECKAYSKLAGLRTVREFASAVEFFRETSPDLQGLLVTTQGFTPNAQKALARHRLLGQTVHELRGRFPADRNKLGARVDALRAEVEHARSKQRRIFVLMPFTDEMLDVFILGIRWAANEVDAVAERADDLEHNGEIIGEIRKAIAEYDAVVADTTGANPNVCYEVGYAHALRRPTVLICRNGERLPFDLKGTNHLMYANILSLRDPLKVKLAAALDRSHK